MLNVVTQAQERRVLLVGHPNAGKSSLFNRLTGLTSSTANYPGTTVDLRTGALKSEELDGKIQLVDAPGVYSLDGFLPEQKVISEVLQSEDFGLVVLVLDGTMLQHQLPLAVEVAQLKKFPLVVAINMVDILDRKIDYHLLEKKLDARVLPISAKTGEGIEDLVEAMNKTEPEAPCIGCTACAAQSRCLWTDSLVADAVEERSTKSQEFTEKIDSALINPWLGYPVFAAIMFAFFGSIFYLASYPMDLIDQAFGWLGEKVVGDTLLQAFLSDAVLAGLGGVVIFIPQICMLFFFICLLEDSGYLARAVVLIDNLMRKFGLPGQAFVPLLSAHACAIPAILSTKLIKNDADRLRTIMVLPLLTCSARLPVYLMVASLVFADEPMKATLLFVTGYGLGILAAIICSLAFKASIIPGRSQRLLLELPPYRVPSVRNALNVMVTRGWQFIRGAGPTILVISIILWAGTSLPTSAESFDESIIGTLGGFIQPIFEPLGFDWRITVAVLTSFAAREVVVSSLGVLSGGAEGDGLLDSLASLTRSDGTLLFDLPTSLSLFVFFVLAMQCLPTNVVTYKETGSLKWPILQFVYMTVLAYGAAFITYQIFS